MVIVVVRITHEVGEKKKEKSPVRRLSFPSERQVAVHNGFHTSARNFLANYVCVVPAS